MDHLSKKSSMSTFRVPFKTSARGFNPWIDSLWSKSTSHSYTKSNERLSFLLHIFQSGPWRASELKVDFFSKKYNAIFTDSGRLLLWTNEHKNFRRTKKPDTIYRYFFPSLLLILNASSGIRMSSSQLAFSSIPKYCSTLTVKVCISLYFS